MHKADVVSGPSVGVTVQHFNVHQERGIAFCWFGLQLLTGFPYVSSLHFHALVVKFKTCQNFSLSVLKTQILVQII
jgi:hypothetical protein